METEFLANYTVFVSLAHIEYGYKLRLHDHVVRMAERSKAPDSRLTPSFAQRQRRAERSGPRMWARVRIPLLTTFFSWMLPVAKCDISVLTMINTTVVPNI